MENSRAQRSNRLRIAAWSVALLVLLLPLFAMQITHEVAWDITDFAVFGALIFSVGFVYELTVRKTGDTLYRFAVATALATVFLLVWVIGAVGLIGVEGDLFDLAYGVVIAVGVTGAFIARFRSFGMAWALFATAVAHGLVVVAAVVAGKHLAGSSSLSVIIMLNGIFIALWCGSAFIFRKAAQDQDRGENA